MNTNNSVQNVGFFTLDEEQGRYLKINGRGEYFRYTDMKGGWTMKETKTYLKDQKKEPIFDKILEYKTYWIQHIDKIKKRQALQTIKNYKPRRLRNRRRFLKRRLKD